MANIPDAVTGDAALIHHRNNRSQFLSLIRTPGAFQNELNSHSQGTSIQSIGTKRKSEALESSNDANTSHQNSKKQRLGFEFITSALRGFNPLNHLYRFLRRVVDTSGDDRSQPDACVEDREGFQPVTDIHHNNDTPIDYSNLNISPIPTVDVTSHLPPAVGPTAEATHVTKPHEPSLVRPSPRYSPPWAKPIQRIKRSDLKRQLKQQTAERQRTYQPNFLHLSDDVGSIKERPSCRSLSSRGSKLLHLAHDAAPLPLVTMLLAPPCKSPHEVFGIGQIEQLSNQVTPARQTMANSSIPIHQLLEPSPEKLYEDVGALEQGGDDVEEICALVSTTQPGDDNDDYDVEMMSTEHEDVEKEVEEVETYVEQGHQHDEERTASLQSPLSLMDWGANATTQIEALQEEQLDVEEEEEEEEKSVCANDDAATMINNTNNTNLMPSLKPTTNHGANNQFTPLPRLLPSKFGFTLSHSGGGGDSIATSPSTCSLIPAGLCGRRSPIHHRKQKCEVGGGGDAMHSKETMNKNTATQATADDEKGNGGDNDMGAFDPNDEALCAEEGCRRVRFVGLSESRDNSASQTQGQQGQDSDEDQSIFQRSAPDVDPAVMTLNKMGMHRSNRPVSIGGRLLGVGPQPRFGLGSFIRLPVATASTVNPPVVEPPSSNGGGVTTALSKDDIILNSNSNVGANDDVNADMPGPPVIARRLQQCGYQLRRVSHPQPTSTSPSDPIPQILREAFLNARLAEHWRNGEAWARVDLSGIELTQDGGPEAHLHAVIATMIGQRGDLAVSMALDQLQMEWEHLKCVRQKYVSSPVNGEAMVPTMCTTAPKGILKHASSVSPLMMKSISNPYCTNSNNNKVNVTTTPPLLAAGFDDILAAEIVPGSCSPQDGLTTTTATTTITATLCGGCQPRELKSRGTRMLSASRNSQTASNGACNTQPPPPPSRPTTDGCVGEVGDHCATGILNRGVFPTIQLINSNVLPPYRILGTANTCGDKISDKTAMVANLDGRYISTSSSFSRRGGSRGHRLLQALQNAAGPIATPTTAAAAARLLVDPSLPTVVGAAGGESLVTGPMATSFVMNVN